MSLIINFSHPPPPLPKFSYVNKWNTKFCSTESPKVAHQRDLHPIKITVCCDVMSQRVANQILSSFESLYSFIL